MKNSSGAGEVCVSSSVERRRTPSSLPEWWSFTRLEWRALRSLAAKYHLARGSMRLAAGLNLTSRQGKLITAVKLTRESHLCACAWKESSTASLSRCLKGNFCCLKHNGGEKLWVTRVWLKGRTQEQPDESESKLKEATLSWSTAAVKTRAGVDELESPSRTKCEVKM